MFYSQHELFELISLVIKKGYRYKGFELDFDTGKEKVFLYDNEGRELVFSSWYDTAIHLHISPYDTYGKNRF